MKKIAFYGGSFDPVHRGHVIIAEKISVLFNLDEFVFVPAFHAPHKRCKKPTSAYHRFAMLCLATAHMPSVAVSTIELDVPERPYAIETLTTLNSDLPDVQIFFVMGADSWQEITTWHEWKAVLKAADHIVVTRPGVEIHFSHVPEDIRERIVDLRNYGEKRRKGKEELLQTIDYLESGRHIYITDVVDLDISATNIRTQIREGDDTWRDDVPAEVAKYVEKYQIYN